MPTQADAWLQKATVKGDHRLIRRSLLRGGNPQCARQAGNTAVHVAALQGDLKAVQQLTAGNRGASTRKPADLRQRNRFHKTAYGCAAESLDPLVPSNAQLLADLSPDRLNSDRHAARLREAQANDWIEKECRERRAGETISFHGRLRWRPKTPPPPSLGSPSPMSPAELRRLAKRREQTTTVTFQGVRLPNVRYPGCARRLPGAGGFGADGAAAGPTQELHLKRAKLVHNDAWPHVCDYRPHMQKQKARGRDVDAGGGGSLQDRIEAQRAAMGGNTACQMGAATPGSAYCRGHGGRYGELWRAGTGTAT